MLYLHRCTASLTSLPAAHPQQGRKVMQMFIGSRRDGGGPQKSAPAGADTRLKLPTASAAIASLPAPAQPGVRIGVAGGELVAVLRFEGYITPATAEAVKKRLMEVLKRGGRCVTVCAGGSRVLQSTATSCAVFYLSPCATSVLGL